MLKIQVLRRNTFVTVTGQFKPPFERKPEVTIKLIKTTASGANEHNLEIKLGVGKASDFNLHIFNRDLGYVELGLYEFSYEAIIPE